MEQIERLLVALSPATIALIKEQIDTYKNEVTGTELIAKHEDQQSEIAWCDGIRETCDQIITDKSE